MQSTAKIRDAESEATQLLMRLRNAQRSWEKEPKGPTRMVLLERKWKTQDEVDNFLRRHFDEDGNYFTNKRSRR